MSEAQTLAAVEAARSNLLTVVNKAFDDLCASVGPQQPKVTHFATPTQQDGLDPSNKNGMNLTPRGVEILYRMFDAGAGYNRAAKMLNITQGAAKNRKALWIKAGGLNRQKQVIDIDR